MATPGLKVVKYDAANATSKVIPKATNKWLRPKGKVKKIDWLFWPLIVILPEWVTPNMLSFGRMIVSLPLILAMYFHFDKLAAYTFIAAAITDGLDGALARWRGLTSQFGKILDPTADKANTGAIFIGFLLRAIYGTYKELITVTITLVLIVEAMLFSVALCKYLVKDYLPHLGKDHWLRNWITPEEITQAIKVKETGANIFGKIKMVLQSVVLPALLLFDPNTSVKVHEFFSFLPAKLTLLELSFPLLLLCIVFGCLSFYGHVKVVHFK